MLGKLRSLASDTLIYGLFMIIGRFLTFMLTPLYTNYMPKEEVGEVIYFYTLISFINIVNSFGMESAYFRFYEQDAQKSHGTAYTLSFLTIGLVSLITSAAVFIFAEPIAPVLTKLDNATELVRLAALIPFLDALMLIPFAYLRMTRRAMRFASIRFLLVIISVIFNFVFVVFMSKGIEGVFLANIIQSVCGVLIFSPNIIKNIRAHFDSKLFRQMLRFGIPTLPASLSAIILQVADRPIIKGLTNAEELAMYGVNYKLGIPMMLFVSVYEYAWKPFYLNNYKEPDAKRLFARILTYFTMICAGIFLATGLFVEFIVQMPFVGGKLIAPEYWPGMSIIPIILGGYYFNGIFTNFSAGLYITKRSEFFPLAMGIAAGLNVLMNFILIPVIGYHGSAWATLAAYFVSAFLLYLFTRKIYPLPYEWKRIGIIIILTLTVYFADIHLTSGMDTTMSVTIRILSLAAIFGILRLMKFYTPAEAAGMKRLFRKFGPGK